jgi:hypothetical protein
MDVIRSTAPPSSAGFPPSNFRMPAIPHMIAFSSVA